MKKKVLALVMIGTVLIGVTGCRWGRSEPSALESSAPKVVDNPEPASEPVQEAAVKPLELPMYEVIDQAEMKVPTARLGEELRIGPITVTAWLKGASNFPIDEVKEALFQIRVRIQNTAEYG
ncbi:hypothetical protein [Thermaerobacter litoralis]